MINLDSEFLKDLAVVDWGYSSNIHPLSFDRYENWVKRDNHGALGYLGDHRKLARRSLKSVYEQCESALVFLFSYHPQKLALEEVYKHPNWNGLKVGSYVLGFEGEDYHFQVKDRLHKIARELKKGDEQLDYRLALDIHPVLERDLAFRSGLGWFGKNSMLISKKYGSYTIVGTLLLNKKLELVKEVKNVEPDHCGQCRACIEACPTVAIDPSSRTIIADQCISTFTIELFKEAKAPEGMENANGEVFGCDICQEVCPWNKRPVRNGIVSAQDKASFYENSRKILSSFLLRPITEVEENLEGISNNKFAKEFKSTPMGRTGRKGMLKNIRFWKLVKES